MNYSIYTIAFKSKIIYVGSTTNFFQRKIEHKSNCFNSKRRNYKIRLYRGLRKLGINKKNFFDKLTFEEIACCKTKEDSKYTENYFIDLFKCFLNHCRNHISIESYSKIWKQNEKYKARQAKYRKTDKAKEIMRQASKRYRDKQKALLNELKAKVDSFV